MTILSCRAVRTLSLLLMGSLSLLQAQLPVPFVPAPQGCPMAHCDVKMSDFVKLNAPTAQETAVIGHDTLPVGKGIGLGCSSNGVFAACTFQDPSGDNLIFYSYNGTRLWSSGALLNPHAVASAPMMSAQGDVIATDSAHVIRVTQTGQIVWSSRVPGGVPVSPVITQSGAVVLATYQGPVSVFDNLDGRFIGLLLLQDGSTGSKYFETVNTPCVNANRVYISTQLTNDPNNTAALVALDVDVSNTAQPITVAWTFTFGAPSGASPLCVGNTIYFDGGRLSPGQPDNPQIFAVVDNGSSPALLWHAAVPSALPANMAQDPRGGIWAIFNEYSSVERFVSATGAVAESLNIARLVGDSTQYPWSAITIAGTQTKPVMLLGTTNSTDTRANVIGIDLDSRSLLWKVNLAPTYGTDNAPSQFPIVLDPNGKPVVVFGGRTSGAYFVAAPAPKNAGAPATY